MKLKKKIYKRFFKYHPHPLPDFPGVEPDSIIPARPVYYNELLGVVLEPTEFFEETIARMKREGIFAKYQEINRRKALGIPPDETPGE